MAVVWWLFALVLITSYTASLASQIIAQHLQAPLIQSIGDLSKQSKINYGCVTKSVTRGLLKESADPHLQRVWSTMEMSGPHAFFESVSTAVVKVREEGLAVLMDSQTIEYLVAHDCSLVQLPGRLETGGIRLRHASRLPAKAFVHQQNPTASGERHTACLASAMVVVDARRRPRCRPSLQRGRRRQQLSGRKCKRKRKWQQRRRGHPWTPVGPGHWLPRLTGGGDRRVPLEVSMFVEEKKPGSQMEENTAKHTSEPVFTGIKPHHPGSSQGVSR
ncbi:hypothetical protein MTO96_027899 [Rhipicephalus appendiculatus]